MAERLRADAVFEGGGVKGIGLVGALAVTEQRGYQWENVAGTSAGAIVAALVAAGFSAAEIKAKMDELDYRSLLDRSALDCFPVIGPLISLGVEKGIYEGAELEKLMRSYLAEKKKFTFRDLVRDPNEQDVRYRYRLQVIASDVSRGRMMVLPQDARRYGIDPDELEIARAVRMSMSLPFFFEPVRLQYKELVEGRERDCESYIVDGGLLSNYPIWLFDARDGAPEWPTFGFRLVEEAGGPEVVQPQEHAITGPVSMLAALFFTAMEAHDARMMEEESWARTISIPTLGVKTTEFDLSPARAARLYEAGQQAARDFFATWDFQEYVRQYRQVREERGRRRWRLAGPQ